MIPVARLNHAVLYVRDLNRSASFYERVFGFQEVGNEFEIMWMVPREEWGEFDKRAVVRPLSLEQESRRHGRPA
jgi:catechol 2,3-dioxygenase-like lactoylglutathione lyase family enzyme